MHYNHKFDENILKKHWFNETYSPLILIKKSTMYYNKFKTSNLVIKNNSSPSIGVLQKKTTLYINLDVL